MTGYDKHAIRERRDWFYKTLEHLANYPEPVYVQHLADDLKCKQPITYKIVETLKEEWEAVEEVEKGKYVLNKNGIFLLCYHERLKENDDRKWTHNSSLDKYVGEFFRKTNKNQSKNLSYLEKEKNQFIAYLTEYDRVKNKLSLSQKLSIGGKIVGWEIKKFEDMANTIQKIDINVEKLVGSKRRQV